MFRSGFFCYGLLAILLAVACREPGNIKEAGPDTAISRRIPAPDTVGTAATRNVTEAEVLDSLRRIPFVAASGRYIDSFSRHKHSIAFLIDTVSDKEVNFRAGYNGDLRFETYYLFTVNPQNFDIKVMEPVSGDQLTIAEYQKAQQQ